MKQNKYDDQNFFEKYSQMDRSKKGLEGAGEWHALKGLLPDFEGKTLLDLGCGFGWHCIYALEQGAIRTVGVDISEKMLAVAREKTSSANGRAEYICMPLEDVDFQENSFDTVLSSLAFHYIQSFEDICSKVHHFLKPGGEFIFSVEHPIFTANGDQAWFYDEKGEIMHWPIDRYFHEGLRNAGFLGAEVQKYHKTLTTYVNSLLNLGFEITGLIEPQPAEHLLETVPGMKDELRRPMMLIISSRKK